MVDVPRLGALLQRIRDEVAALRHLARREGIRDDDVALPAAKYRLVVAIEAMIDVAEHVIASEGLRPATSFADSFRSLAEGGWIDTELAGLLADAARFRNVLVHQYTDVDDDRVVEILRTRLDDLDRFVTTMAGRLEAGG
jgi:uncharacterized protein YutE (UPF0331/DUF86 family)